MARERRSSSSLALLMAVLLLSLLVSAGLYLIQASPEYKPPYERIDIYANKVQPLGDSCEQYPYFDLPFCPPEEQRFHNDRKKSLQDILAGDCFSHTQYLVFFLNDSDMVTLCEKNLTRAEVAKFRNAIQRKFEYQFAFENLFMRSMVGRISEEENCNVSSTPRYYLVTHIQFYVSYSEGRVKQISIINDNNYDVDVTEDTEIMNIKFTYSVYWDIVIDHETEVLLNQLTPEVDEWFAEDYRIWKIISFLTFWPGIIVIWVGLLLDATVPKFKSYFSGRPYFHGDEHSQKKDISPYIHGDTCSCPPYTFFLGAIIGTGTQLFIMLCIFIYFAFKGIIHPCNLKGIFSQIFQTYCYSSIFAAYKTTAFHGSFSLISWKESIYLTGAVYFIPFFFLITLALNFLATAKFVIPFAPELSFIAQDLVIWAFLTCIFLSVGSTIAHLTRSRQKVLCPTRKLSRENHQQSLFLKTPVQMLLGGLIPFLILLPEMDNIYATLWNKKICGTVDTILYSFIYLVTLTVPISVGFSHYEFYKQDYQWWWRSVFRGGSTAIYMFFYGFYFFSRTHIEQTLLLVQLLCYNACIFYALFLILGTASFYASSLIFHYAYQLQKDE